MTGRVTRFLGDTPGRTVVKLLVLSFIVGLIMSAMNWYPMDMLYAARDFLERLWETGFAAFGRFGQYLALGAVIVVPIFVVVRLLNLGRPS
ncbi:DUF6460 domain-containing protein [Pararhizobium mangrovi]|uniref:DUF6460 domain-containing protein n=1 Tax=Pararhizobium mangrovi TaxID=2590452 RepID=A0A506TUR4_9HYPH|nr:DUF6460 domain-containing protein [Pararhizobium mangrovi]TPW25802.1 hypothetical protein FJU11_17765 [Pararhizobium mangrovi]